jgi:hypothetical protein
MLAKTLDFERVMGLKCSLTAYTSRAAVVLCISSQALLFSSSRDLPSHTLLDPQKYRHYFEQFTNAENEMLGETDPPHWTSLEQNIPWLDVPDKSLEEIYYFRRYSFRKRIKPTPSGFVIDEFAVDIPWAVKYNTITLLTI